MIGSGTNSDVIVVGGGIAGISVAAELATRHSVTLLEREPQLAYHTTGRSAAMYLESYGSPEIQAITRASGPLFDAAGDHPLLSPRPVLYLARTDQLDTLDDQVAQLPWLARLTGEQARELCSALDPTYVAAASLDISAMDIDVLGLHQHYLRTAKKLGAQVHGGTQVLSGRRLGDGWLIETDQGRFGASVVVNAAGAWADEVARLFGVTPVGLQPLRRTAAVAPVSDVDPSWPMVICVDEEFYFRPEGAGVLLSPADETPSDPIDARAEDLDVALAIERVNEATTLGIRSIRASWAGLRTFAADRNPVVGMDPDHAGFCWLAGQGGYGIQTAPGMAVLAAALADGRATPATLVAAGLDPTRLAPIRLR